MSLSFKSGVISLPALASCLLISVTHATADYPSPLCGGPYDLCWYVDRETVSVTSQQFEQAHSFSEGLAAVRIKGRFGYIDSSGTIVIEPQFDLAGDFYQGLAEVRVGEKAGVINRHGEFVLKPEFARAAPLTKDVIVVDPGKWYAGRFVGAEKIFGRPAGLSYPSSARLFSLKTGWVTEQAMKVKTFDNSGRGLIWARATDDRYPLFGLMRADGTWQVEPQYDDVGELCYGHARVGTLGQIVPSNMKLRWVGRSGRRYGAVDKDGNLVVPLGSGLARYCERFRGYVRNAYRYAWDQIINCPGGTSLYRDGQLWGIKGPSGNVIVKATHRAISCFRHGLAWAAFDNERAWCPIRPNGVRADLPSCERSRYPHLRLFHRAESFHKDRYESSVLWANAYLEYGAGLRSKRPGVYGPNQF